MRDLIPIFLIWIISGNTRPNTVCRFCSILERHSSIKRLCSTRPALLDTVAIRFPDVKIIMAHLSHPYEGECAVVIRKHENVYADCSALHYRPFQLYHSLMLIQEYGVWDKVLFGTDYPFTTVNDTIAGVRKLNDMLEGTKLPRLNMEQIDKLIYRDSLSLLGLA